MATHISRSSASEDETSEQFRARVVWLIDSVLEGQSDMFGQYVGGHDILEALHAAGLVVTEMSDER